MRKQQQQERQKKRQNDLDDKSVKVKDISLQRDGLQILQPLTLLSSFFAHAFIHSFVDYTKRANFIFILSCVCSLHI